MRTPIIIFLNGTLNAGKSTVARLLAKKFPKTAIVEIDDLYKCIQWIPLEKAIPLNLQNAVSLIRNFVARGYNVIVPYPLSEKNWQAFNRELKGVSVDTSCFTLAPSKDTVLKRRGQRKLDNWDRRRIEYHYEISLTSPTFGTIIDNTNQTPEETAAEIFNRVSNNER